MGRGWPAIAQTRALRADPVVFLQVTHSPWAFLAPELEFKFRIGNTRLCIVHVARRSLVVAITRIERALQVSWGSSGLQKRLVETPRAERGWKGACQVGGTFGKVTKASASSDFAPQVALSTCLALHFFMRHAARGSPDCHLISFLSCFVRDAFLLHLPWF